MSVWLYEMAVLIHTKDIPQIRYEHVIFLWDFIAKAFVFLRCQLAGEYGAVYIICAQAIIYRKMVTKLIFSFFSLLDAEIRFQAII